MPPVMPAWIKLQTGIAASDEGGGGDGEGGGGDGEGGGGDGEGEIEVVTGMKYGRDRPP